MISRTVFRSTLADLATKAREALPESNGRIDSAVKLVLGGDVELLPDGAANVGSSSDALKQYFVNVSCSCRDYEQAPQQFCKHRLARALQIRLARICGTDEDNSSSENHDPTTGLPDALKPHLVYLHGKPFVRFAGLLALAHTKGLVSLKARFISVTAELALAEAEATFADGTTYAECADATPQNVGKQVAAHFPRLALTRAKARCLRDALNIAECSLEELGEVQDG